MCASPDVFWSPGFSIQEREAMLEITSSGMIPPGLQLDGSSPRADFVASESHSQTLEMPKLVLDYRVESTDSFECESGVPHAQQVRISPFKH